MIVKFFARGKGGGSGPVDYLLSKDRERALAKPLRGDPEEMIELINASPYAKKYTAGVLSFQEADLEPERKEQIMNSFERALLPGLDGDQYSCLWVEHRDKDRLELNFVVPNIELISGKRLQPYYYRADRPRIKAWKSWVNAALDLHDPDDPGNRQIAILSADLPENKKKAIEKITEAVTAMIAEGGIKDRQDIVDFLEKNEFTIARQKPTHISILDPKGGRNLRLKGAIYEEYFRADQLLGGEHERATEKFKRDREERGRLSRELYRELSERKREDNRRRYQRPAPPVEETSVDQLEERSTDSNLHPATVARPRLLPGKNDQGSMEPDRQSEQKDRTVERPGGGYQPEHVRGSEEAMRGDRTRFRQLRQEASPLQNTQGALDNDGTGKSLIERLAEIAKGIFEAARILREFCQGIADDVRRYKEEKRRDRGALERLDQAAKSFIARQQAKQQQRDYDFDRG